MTIEFLKSLGLDEDKATALLQEIEALICAEYERGLAEGRASLDEYKANQAVSAVLNSCGAKNPELLKSLIDMDALVFENGEVSGLKEQIAAIKQENPFLFEEEQPSPHFSAKVKSENKISKKSFDKMSYMDRVKLYSTNPTLYKQLIG